MLYQITDFLLLRIPLISSLNYQIDDPGQIMADRVFMSAISLASPDFYGNLEKKKFEQTNLNERERNTLRKYFNRSCFRSTPFGLFSSVSLIGWGEERLSISIGGEAQILHLHPDRSFLNRTGRELAEGPLAASAHFGTNPLLYRMGDEYRFVRSGLDDLFEKRDYLLQSIAYSQVLKKLFDFCRRGKARAQIIGYITKLAGCTKDEATAYFEFLTDAQILLNSLRPNLTGTGYFERLRSAMYPGKAGYPQKMIPGHSAFQLNVGDITPHELKVAAEHFSRGHFAEHAVHPVKSGGIFERKLSGYVASEWKEVLKDALFALDKLCPEPANLAMEEFAKNFDRRFEHQAIPLLQALDPEFGIGYFFQPGDQGQLLETLDIQTAVSFGKPINWTAAHSLLLNSWERCKGSDRATIELEKDELEKLTSQGKDKGFLGSSVLFRIIDQQILIESAGGVNALALIGRFTPDIPGVFEAAKQIAEQQEAANPGLIFAEILHLLNSKAENVALRKNIWSWDIPLTAASTQPGEKQILPDDLYVTVNSGTVYLWSRKHRKMVIPRLTSAYNHQLNQLPLFRFLADLPYQYGRSSLTLTLRQFFPGLRFYPRVCYRKSILHLATWILNESEIELLQKEQPQLIVSGFSQLDGQRHLPDVFALTEGDQQLVFFKRNESEILFFAACLKNRKEAIVYEYLTESEEAPLVRDEKGRPFANQFSVPLNPVGSLGFKLPASLEYADKQSQRNFIPGSEWLYLKIYSSRATSAKLLSRIYPLIKKKYGCGKVLKWFFIRYEDHAPHIRLRLRINPGDTGEILSAFKTRLEDKIRQHVIREYQVDVYIRELERYQGVNYELTENLFWASSELVYHWLNKKKASQTGGDHLLAIRGLRDILDVFIPERSQQVNFTQDIYSNLMTEFGSAELKRDLDRKYRELTGQLRLAMKDGFYQENYVSKPGAGFKKALREIAESQTRATSVVYLSGIIHMHLNRVFTSEPRKQEMIVYYLYHKLLLSEMARNKR